MIINMTTIASRQKHYIDRTLESLAQSDGRDVPVNLIMGSSDASHVERYRGVLNIVSWDEESESQARQGKARLGCTLNAIRALKYGADDQCLCCEDDIRFEPDWLSQLRATVAEIPGDEYVLNLVLHRNDRIGNRYGVDSRPYLCGAQALFYPTKALRDRVARYVEERARSAMNDKLVGDFAKRHAALYTTIPVLVHHIGEVSCFRKPPTESTGPLAP